MRKFLINVNGKSYDVEVTEVGGVAAEPVVAPAAAPAPAAPATSVAAPAAKAPAAPANGTSVSAPMPGTILKVNVSVGSTVNEGDAVVVLEAMKMENDIPAPCSGKIVAVNVNQGDTVESGDTLVVIG